MLASENSYKTDFCMEVAPSCCLFVLCQSYTYFFIIVYFNLVTLKISVVGKLANFVFLFVFQAALVGAEEGVPENLPDSDHLSARLCTVPHVIHLIFWLPITSIEDIRLAPLVTRYPEDTTLQCSYLVYSRYQVLQLPSVYI